MSIDEILADPHNKAAIESLIARGTFIPFVGAGLSTPYGYPGWTSLLKHEIHEMVSQLTDGGKELRRKLKSGEYLHVADELDALLNNNLAARMQIHFDAAYMQTPQDETAIQILRQFDLPGIVTTNYDEVLENEFAEYWGRRLFANDLSEVREAIQNAAEVPIIHLHGCVKVMHSIILTTQSYENKYIDGSQACQILSYLYNSIFPLLFLGCSLSKDYMVAHMNKLGRNTDSFHYAILPEPGTLNAKRQKGIELTQLGIHPIWYPKGKHDYVQVILTYLLNQTPRRGSKQTIPNSSKLIGRENKRQKIIQRLNSSENFSLLLFGSPGIGKTALAKSVMKYYQNARQNRTCKFISLRGATNYYSIFEALGASLQLANNKRNSSEIVSILKKETPYFLVMDNVEDALRGNGRKEFEELLHSLSTIENLKILFTSQARDEIFSEREPVTPLRDEYTQKIFLEYWEKKNGVFTHAGDQRFSQLIKELNGHPLATILVASQGCTFDETIRKWNDARCRIVATPDEQENHHSLLTALYSAYRRICDDKVALKIWGIMALLPQNLTKDLFWKVFHAEPERAIVALEVMVNNCLVTDLGNSYEMLMPVRKPIFDFADNNTASVDHKCIWAGSLAKVYLDMLREANPAKKGWSDAYAAVSAQTDNILFLMHELCMKMKEISSDIYRELFTRLHLHMENFYALNMNDSYSLLKEYLEILNTTNIDPNTTANIYRIMASLLRRKGDMDSARKYYELAETSFRDKFSIEYAHLLLARGDFLRRSNVMEARRNYEAALALYTMHRDSLGKANSLQGLGALSSRECNFSLVMDFYEKAEEEYKQAGDTLGMGNIYLRMGINEFRLQSYSAALIHFEQAEVEFIRSQSQISLADLYVYWGDLDRRQRRWSPSRDKLEKARQVFEDTKDTTGQAHVHLRRGLWALDQRRHGIALSAFEEAAKLFGNDSLGRANALQGIGRVRISQKKFDLALPMLMKAEKEFKAIHDRIGLANTQIFIVQVYTALKEQNQLFLADEQREITDRKQEAERIMAEVYALNPAYNNREILQGMGTLENHTVQFFSVDEDTNTSVDITPPPASR